MDRRVTYPLVACLGTILLLSLLPLVPQVLSGAGMSGAVNPQYLESYYTPMTREVADGHPLMGNPYFLEHRGDVAPAFILPFWISAVPILAGLPLAGALALNFSFWSIVFGILLYAFFRKLGFSEIWCSLATLVVYLQSYGQLMRPVSMQIVLPSFAFFLLAYFLWRERPRSPYRHALLGCASALAIYAYTYQLQIIAAFLGIAFIHLLYRRDWDTVRHALVVGIWTAVLCIPFLIITFAQLHNPDYIDSMLRIGLGYTRWPAGEAYVSGVRILGFTALVYMMWAWLYRGREPRHAGFIAQFILLGIAMEIVSLANVITGLDLETASHAARFVATWLIVGSVVAAYFLFVERASLVSLSPIKKMTIGILAAFVVLSNIAYTPNILGSFDFNTAISSIKDEEQYIPVLQWIDSKESLPVVIWVEPHSSLGWMIPVYTKHYVLFRTEGALQIMPSAEVQERYLVASTLSDVTYEHIAADLSKYGLNGYERDTPYSINRGTRMCMALQLPRLGFPCGELTNSTQLFTPLFESMFARYTSDIQPNLQSELQKFHVSYIVKDSLNDADFHPERLSVAKQVYDDGRFTVYELLP